jgi:hypothetical protein
MHFGDKVNAYDFSGSFGNKCFSDGFNISLYVFIGDDKQYTHL